MFPTEHIKGLIALNELLKVSDSIAPPAACDVDISMPEHAPENIRAQEPHREAPSPLHPDFLNISNPLNTRKTPLKRPHLLDQRVSARMILLT